MDIWYGIFHRILDMSVAGGIAAAALPGFIALPLFGAEPGRESSGKQWGLWEPAIRAGSQQRGRRLLEDREGEHPAVDGGRRGWKRACTTRNGG